MRKTIKLMLDYQCYPIWVYNEEGKFIDNDIIQEIEENTELYNLLNLIQNRYDSLFLNKQTEFAYVGFSNANEKSAFINQIGQAYKKLVTLLANEFDIINAVNYDAL